MGMGTGSSREIKKMVEERVAWLAEASADVKGGKKRTAEGDKKSKERDVDGLGVEGERGMGHSTSMQESVWDEREMWYTQGWGEEHIPDKRIEAESIHQTQSDNRTCGRQDSSRRTTQAKAWHRYNDPTPPSTKKDEE